MKQKHVIVGMILIIAITALAGSAIIFLNRQQATESTRTRAQRSLGQNQAVATPTPALDPRNPVLELNPRINGDQLEIWVNPTQPNTKLSAFAFRIYLNASQGNVALASSKPTIPPAFQQSDWTYPFATTETENGQTALKMSGVHIATQPYDLTGETLFATIPLSASSAEITSVTVDPTVSEFFNEAAKAMHFTREDQPIRVN